MRIERSAIAGTALAVTPTAQRNEGDEGQIVRPAPLDMPDQRLDAPFADPSAPGVAADRATRGARLLVLGLPVLPALLVGWLAAAWLVAGPSPHVAGYFLAVMSGFAAYWLGLPLVAAVLGAIARAKLAPARPVPALKVAILLPMYGEDARETIEPAVTLLRSLTKNANGHRFCLRILSDTRDLALAQTEARVAQAAMLRWPGLDISWRRRPENRDFKSGNLRDWFRTEGHLHDAALVLDADSRMGAATVLRMADELAADPATALIQTVPRVAPGQTVWQRLQSLASEVYGRNLGRGFAVWTGTSGNYLGHNAILRTGAFARCAGLPHLPGKAPLGGVILSHDFVEAALLRRAGWGVRMLPEAEDSFEETPETLVGYVRRDARWCQGNMQHLRLLTKPGYHPMSRLHFLQGAYGFLSSPVWLVMLSVFAFIPPAPALGTVGMERALLALVFVLLFAPKLVGLVAYLRRVGLPRGEGARFAASVVAENVLSFLVAPVLMVQQTRAVLATFTGRNTGWFPHAKGRPSFSLLLRLHVIETVAGIVLTALVAVGLVTPWLLLVAGCLLLAAPLSWLVQQDAPDWLGPPAARVAAARGKAGLAVFRTSS